MTLGLNCVDGGIKTNWIIKCQLEERHWLIPGLNWHSSCFVPVYYIQIGAELDLSPSFCCHALVLSKMEWKPQHVCRQDQFWRWLRVQIFWVLFTVVFISNIKNVALCKWVETHPALLGFEYYTTGQNTSLRYACLKQELKPHQLTTSTFDAQKHAFVTASVEQFLRDQKQSSTILTCWNKTKPIPIESLYAIAFFKEHTSFHP